ncbi:putative type IX secretion system sortase PorU2 [Spirosoma fluminis]
MLRAYLVLFLLTVCVRSLLAQPLSAGHEWINSNQTYFKLPVAETGLYRIRAVELERAGFPVSTVDPTTVQVFHRGIEQAIFVAGEADKRFDTDDFLEFYGRGNDGAQDSLLYHPVGAQPHPYYSLFSDTTVFFLTWRLDGTPGKRMAAYSDTSYASLPPEPYYWAEDMRLFTDNYPGYPAGIPPRIEFSYYEAGEGYTGPVQQKDKPYVHTFALRQAYTNGAAPELTILLAGRDNTNHRVECWVGPSPDRQRLTDSTFFSTYDNARLQLRIRWSDVGPDGRLTVSLVSRGDNAPVDRYSVSFMRLRYPKHVSLEDNRPQTFQLAPTAGGRSRLDLPSAPTETCFWDITDPINPIRLGATVSPAGLTQVLVHGTTVPRTIFSASQRKSAISIRPVTFPDWRGRKPTYLIITHEALLGANAVRDYAAYRASPAGGAHDTLTVTMQQLIDQYSFGERHPLAIRRFADQMLRQGSPQYLLLIGRSRSTPGIRRNPEQAALDMVMTAGFPGSDMAFTAGLADQPVNVPAIPTGRINASSPQEVISYLNKVIEYEAQPGTLWRKNMLHLSGGATADQAVLFRSLVDGYKHRALAPSLGAQVTTLSKQTDNSVEPINVVQPVNEGVGLMTFFGHSGLDVTDLDIGFCTNDALGYQNKGKYPVLLINGCAIGNFFFGRPTLTTDWVLAPNRGAIAALAHSHLGYVEYLNQYSTTFYELLADSTQLSRPIGQLQQETIRRVLAQTPDGWSLANCQQMVLQGDPAIRLFPFETPDYAIPPNSVVVSGSDGQPLRAQSDSVQIRFVVQNSGQYRERPFPIRIRRFVNTQEVGMFNLTLPNAVAYRDTLTVTLPNQHDADGLNRFELTLNPNGLIPERQQNNNHALVDVLVAGQKPILLYPAPGSVINTTSLRLSAEFLRQGRYPFDLELDTTARFSSPFRIQQRIRAANLISYPANLLPDPNITYYWRVRLADSTGLASPADESKAWSASTFTYVPLQATVGLPEGHLQMSGTLPGAVQQGDTVAIPVRFTNLSAYPFADSVTVRQTIFAAALPEPQTREWRLPAPAPYATLAFVIHIATQALPGLNRIVLTVNPGLQPEYLFHNNTGNFSLAVQPDQVGPLLEVAVDGDRINDGATVSAQPLLDILLTDDNRSISRQDTAGLNLFLQRPGLNQPFERLSWHPAKIQPSGSDKAFRIRYPLPLLAEGLYQVLVTARDAVGNSAIPFQVRFRVILEPGLTNLNAYPNPFSDQTFVTFQLTGAQPPATLALTIMNLAGKVVRQFHKPGRIGLNVWSWDGCADSGAPLPSGVYLYRLSVGKEDPTWPGDVAERNQRSGRLLLMR